MKSLKTVSATPTAEWSAFEELVRQVSAAAQKRSEAHLYRLLIASALMAHAGLMGSTVLKLKWKDVLMPFPIRVQEKNKKHAFPVSKPLRILISEAYGLAKLNWADGEMGHNYFIVPNLKSGGTVPMTDKCLREMLKKEFARFGIPMPKGPTHTLRKMYARRKLAMSANPRQTLVALSRELKHSSTVATLQYLGMATLTIP